MATKEVATNVAYLYLCVDYSTSIVGDYPNIKFRFSYKMRFHLTAYGSVQYTGATFKFGYNSHSFNVNYTAPAGGGYSSYLVSGTIDYDWGKNRSVTKEPTFSTSFGNVSASGSVSATQTIPEPSVYQCENPRDVTPFEATIDYLLTNSHNYWRVYLLDSISNKTWDVDPNTEDGSITLTNLTPETRYNITACVIDRNESLVYTGGIYAAFTTLVDQAKLFIKQSGSWKKGKAFLKKDGSWVKIKKVYLKQNGSWNKATN